MYKPTYDLPNKSTDQQCMHNSNLSTMHELLLTYAKQLSSKLGDTKIVLIRNSSKEKDNRNREGEERSLRKEAKTYAERG